MRLTWSSKRSTLRFCELIRSPKRLISLLITQEPPVAAEITAVKAMAKYSGPTDPKFFIILGFSNRGGAVLFLLIL